MQCCTLSRTQVRAEHAAGRSGVKTTHEAPFASWPERVSPWVSQDCKLDAVLVLRIQNGNDIFLSVTGCYAPSFFGISLPSLASLPRYSLRIPSGPQISATIPGTTSDCSVWT